MTATFVLPKDSRDSAIAKVTAFLAATLPGKSVRVTVEQASRKRSDEQNRYLWGVAYKTLEQATGQPAADWHEYALGEHFGWETGDYFGTKKLRPLRRSSKLSTVEFMEFVGFIQQRAAENGIYISDPNEGI